MRPTARTFMLDENQLILIADALSSVDPDEPSNRDEADRLERTFRDLATDIALSSTKLLTVRTLL
jgi:hypothetical protein